MRVVRVLLVRFDVSVGQPPGDVEHEDVVAVPDLNRHGIVLPGLALVGVDPDPAPLMFMVTLAGLRLFAGPGAAPRRGALAALAPPFGLLGLLFALRSKTVRAYYNNIGSAR